MWCFIIVSLFGERGVLTDSGPHAKVLFLLDLIFVIECRGATLKSSPRAMAEGAERAQG